MEKQIKEEKGERKTKNAEKGPLHFKGKSERIEALMNNRLPFRKNALKVTDAAKEPGTNRLHVSRAVNMHPGASFDLQ